jgi:hypothetical protein
MAQLRREVPRQTIHWEGEYRVDGDAEGRWRRCRIIDVSTAGAGLELLDARPEETCGRQITVAVQLHGEVKNSSEGAEDSLRVGIQFVELTPSERNYLESLAQSQARW